MRSEHAAACCSCMFLYTTACMHICPGVLSQPSYITCQGSVSAPVRCSASAVDRFGRSSDASSDTLQRGVPAVLSNLQALYQFSRPHTMLGTFISICSVSLLAMVCISTFCHPLISTALTVVSRRASATLSVCCRPAQASVNGTLLC